MTKKTKNAINFIHDHAFRMAMEDLRVAKDFFQQFLPTSLQDQLELDTLQPVSSSFVRPDRRGKTSDVLFKVATKDKDAFLCLLIEHQSLPDENMPLRIAEYVLATMNKYKYRDKDSKKLCHPLVIPLVFYHGKRPYPYGTDLHLTFKVPASLAEQYFVIQKFILIDVMRIPDEELLRHTWSGLLACVHKHIYESDFNRYFVAIASALSDALRQDGRDYVVNIVDYVIRASTITYDEFEIVMNNIVSDELRGEMMTLADYLQQKGLERGRQEGRQEGKREGQQEGLQQGKSTIAKKMLAEGIAVELIAKLTDLPQTDIELLKSEGIKKN